MKKLLFISALLFAATTFAQEKPKPDYKAAAEKAKTAVDNELKFAPKNQSKELATAKGDTLTIGDAAKFIVIKDRIYPVAAFTQSVPVFLSADAWGAVLEIINSRDYGKIPATTIGQIIQAIGQQIPRKEN